MSSSTEISNIAISHLGIGKEIANLETEQSQEARACRRFYETAKTAVLRDFNWPFANTSKALALIEENPTTEWKYSYRYPTDALRLLRIFSGVRNDTRQSRIPYRILSDSIGKIIYCDEPQATLEYIRDIDDPTIFAPDFTLALSYRLAFYVAPQLTGGDPFQRQQQMLQLYLAELSTARANASNEFQQEEEPRSELERVRDGYDRYDVDRRRT